MRFIRVLSLLALSALAGCTYTFPNTPLVAHSSNTELLPIAPATTRSADEPYIVMSFSGGGIRATGFAYAVLNELAQVPDRSGRPFSADVQIISSASGGSVTAAWFGLKGDAGLPYLRNNFIALDNMAALESQVLNPIVLLRLAGPNYSRSDVVRDYFDRHLFHGATIGDVYHRPGAPLIILNATDMATGEVFSFRSDRFDDLCSDLSRFPLATAVAASAAVPIAVTPISLKNFSGNGCPVNPYPTHVRIDLTTATRYLDLPAYKQSMETVRMRGCPFPCADPAHRNPSVLYQHLLDGGLADNLGTSAILRDLFNPDPSSQLRRLNDGTIRNLVAIQVVARTSTPSPVSVQPATPGVVSVTNAVIDNPMNAATRGNAEIFETAIGDLRQAGRLRALAPAPVGIPDRIYGIEVDPDQFDATKPDQVALRDRFEHIATSWSMNADALATVEQAAHRLLYQHPCFIRLLLDRSTRTPEELAHGAPIGDPAACDYDASAQSPGTSSARLAQATNSARSNGQHQPTLP